MRRKWIFIVPAAIAGLVLFAFLGGEIVRLLWNWLLPPLFGWHELTFWQALALLALCRILFGRTGLRGSKGRGIRGRIRERLAGRTGGRWDHMTPEERERFRQGMRDACGLGPGPGDPPAKDSSPVGG